MFTKSNEIKLSNQIKQARTIICEPIRYHGEIVAVVQCYNKSGDPEEAHFSPVGTLIL